MTMKQENLLKALHSAQFLSSDLRAVKKDYAGLDSRGEQAGKLLKTVQDLEKQIAAMLNGLD